ncbi:TIGR04222 domain-containing membrane protein, partial [Geodermatophilus maliterrae]
MTASRTPADLDVYEVAFLAGGATRSVETAVVALVESGRVRVRSPGELTVVSPARQHPVEAAVLDALGPRGHRSVETACWRAADDPRLLELG